MSNTDRAERLLSAYLRGLLEGGHPPLSISETARVFHMILAEVIARQTTIQTW